MTELEDINKSVDKKTEDIKSDGKQETTMKFLKVKYLKYRVVKTVFLFLSWIALGLFSEVTGPAVPAIKNLTNTNYEEIGRALATRASGLFIGSLFGGILSDVFSHRRNLLIFTFLLIAGVSTATLPICRTLSTLCLNLFIHGLSHGGFTTSGNPSLNALWKEKSSGPFNFIHAGYGIGASIAPVLLKAFDVSNISINSNQTSSQNGQYIQMPFFIVGMYCVLIALVFFIYCFISNPVDKSELPLVICNYDSVSVEKDEANSTLSNGDYSSIQQITKRVKLFFQTIDRYMVFIMCLAFVGYFGIVGNERIFGKFQFVYATESRLQMSKSNGYLINALYWVAFTMGRIIVALIALKVSSRILLISEICGALMSSAVFTIWSDSQRIFFIFTTFFGLFKSPLFPTMLGVLSLYVTVSGTLTMMVNFGSSVGAMICQYLAGYLIHSYGYRSFPILVTATTVVLLCIFSLMLLLTRKWKKIQSNN